MKAPGYVLAVIGLVIAIIGVLDKLTHQVPVVKDISKGSLIVGIIGGVIFLVGVAMAFMGGSKQAS
jgi:hypothetical protein